MPRTPVPNALADKLKKWQQLRDTLPQLLEEAPHLRADHVAFDAALEQLIALEHGQEAATAKLREATRLRDEQIERVRQLNSRLVAGAQAHLGPEHERLIAFSISPRRRRRGRKKAEPAAPAPAPAPPQEPTK